ncbi:hypothetical protein CHLNCDRAFT_18419 [Chlorella variabilis]|uniref:Monooxygenase n=1 Tax=Chlorella variabilis TaxID=554065 RepID=E1Z2Y0_CHLVA|nr:hypothetical protein CHLNCDRAFT_18419 [Chlorella variabilis]EFN59746.1 hypothetical protein CHLNCDRAFT_18419 [Chlorella variabilis]|eukprot:XP_005851848.1 hypothetical protein CHLNCDRAFT_18419 [Chlorella variabilis]
MSVLLQVDFPFQGPFGDATTEGMRELAHSIAHEPGLIWKASEHGARCGQDQERGEAGGVYLFSDRASAEAYMAMHEARLKVFGVPHVNVKVWAARVGGTQIKQGAGQPHNPPPLTPTTCCCSIST